jgi:hypothetical protein
VGFEELCGLLCDRRLDFEVEAGGFLFAVDFRERDGDRFGCTIWIESELLAISERSNFVDGISFGIG